MALLHRLFHILPRQARYALSSPVRRVQLSLLGLALLILLGTLYYHFFEDMTSLDALYMTVITIATVGFGEVKPLSPDGRVFTIILILLGVGITTTAISNAVGVILGPRLWLSIQQRRMEAILRTLKNHYIVCGYGRMGQQIVLDLQRRQEAFVVVDANPEIAEELIEAGIPHIVGDATLDEALSEAGVTRAQGLVAALSSDADNVLTVLSARELNPKIYIVARATSPEAERKLRRAGANTIVSPYQIGGHRMALALLRPTVHRFLMRIFHFGEGPDVEIGQITIREGSWLASRTIATSNLRAKHQVSILAIQEPDGEFVITPSIQHQLRAGQTLIVIGPPQAIYALEEQLDESPDLL